MPLLEVTDLRVTYPSAAGPVPAVRGVSLRIGDGQVLGIAGESGCGKSSMARAILRLNPRGTAVTGRIALDGDNVPDMSWGRLRAVRWAHTSVVFQGGVHSLNPVQRLGRQIAEPILLHERVSRDEAGRRASALLEQVGLPSSRKHDYPHELSGGQRQRVMIAMALACSPRLIIADEPTSALDVIGRGRILRLLTGLVQQRGIGLMLVSHDLSVLASACHRLAVMYAGRIVEEGPAGDVVGDPRHPYTRALVASSPVIGDPASRRRPQGLAGDPPDPLTLPRGCAFHPRCTTAPPGCATTPVELDEVCAGRRVACVLSREPQWPVSSPGRSR